MKIKKQTTNKFVVAMVLVATALVAVTTGVTWLMTTRQVEHDRKTAGKVVKQEQADNHDMEVSKAAGDDGSYSKDDKSDKNNKKPTDKPKVQQFGNDFNADDKNKLSALISTLSWSVDTLTIRTTVAQHMDGRKGSCILTLTGPNKLTYTETVDLQDDPQASTCLGYDIPLRRISPSKKLWSGEWKVNIKIKAVDKDGRVVGTEVNDKITR